MSEKQARFKIIVDTGQSSEAIKKATQDADKLDKTYEELEKQTEEASKAQADMGKEVADASNLIKSAFGSIGIDVDKYSNAYKSATTSTKAFTTSSKALRMALIALPIIAIVTALMTLYKAFSSTQEGADRINRILEPLKATLETLWGVLQQVALTLSDKVVAAFKDPQQAIRDLGDLLVGQVINRFNGMIEGFGAIGRAISSLVKGDWQGLKDATADYGNALAQTITGVEDAGTKFLQFGKDIAEATKQGIEGGRRLQELNEQIEKLRIAQEVPLARQRREYQELYNSVRDVSLTEEERIKNGQRAIEIQKEILAEELKLLDLEIERLELQQEFNDTDREGQLELQRLLARREDLAAGTERALGRILVQVTTLQKQVEGSLSAEEEANQKVILAMQDRANQYREMLKSEEELNQEALQANLNAVQELFDNKIITEQEYYDIKAALEEEFATKSVETEKARAGSILEIEQELQELQKEFKEAESQEQRDRIQAEIDGMNEVLAQRKITTSESIRLAKEESAARKTAIASAAGMAIQAGLQQKQSAREVAIAGIQAAISELMVQQFGAVIKALPFPVNAIVAPLAAFAAGKAAEALIPKFSTGGTVVGAGTGTSDSIIAKVSTGEEIIRADAASRNRSLLKAINSGAKIGGDVSLNDNGLVNRLDELVQRIEGVRFELGDRVVWGSWKRQNDLVNDREIRGEF